MSLPAWSGIFAHTASGATYPEFVSVNQKPDGSVTVSVRSPATFDVMQSDDPPLAVCGATAEATLPREQIDSLIQGLLTLPPVDEVREAKPLVLYFATDADREECIAAIQAVKPNMRAVRV